MWWSVGVPSFWAPAAAEELPSLCWMLLYVSLNKFTIPMWTSHLTLSRSAWYMDGCFRLQAGRELMHGRVHTVKHKQSGHRQRKSAPLSAFGVPACVNLCLSDVSDYSMSDSYFHCICKSTSCSRPLWERDCVVCCPKRRGLKHYLAVVML